MATLVIPQHKRKFSTLTAETPTFSRQTGSGAYHAGGLFEKAHTTALNDLGSWIPQVSIVFVLDNILPLVRCNYKVAKVQLEQWKRIANGQWATFSKGPAKSKTH